MTMRLNTSWSVGIQSFCMDAIDLMVKIKGLDFEECYADSIHFEGGEIRIRTIQKLDLIKAKKSAGRAKDLNDLENIE